MAETAGIIGIGIMGGAMARALVGKGFRVVGYDVSADALDRAAADGVETAGSAAATTARRSATTCCSTKPTSCPTRRRCSAT